MKIKAFLVVVVYLVLSLNLNNCYADNDAFSFRHDIQFGDSMKTVINKIGYEQNRIRNEDELYSYNLNLSGINNSSIFYTFSNDKLIAMQLRYGCNDTDTDIINYNSIEEGLKRKYGEPVEDVDNTTYYGSAFYLFNNFDNGDKSVLAKTAIGKNKWIIKANDNDKIVIEHILFNYQYGTSKDGTPELKYYHVLSYQFFSDEFDKTYFIDKDL